MVGAYSTWGGRPVAYAANPRRHQPCLAIAAAGPAAPVQHGPQSPKMYAAARAVHCGEKRLCGCSWLMLKLGTVLWRVGLTCRLPEWSRYSPCTEPNPSDSRSLLRCLIMLAWMAS
jgi:hypothetical protein